MVMSTLLDAPERQAETSALQERLGSATGVWQALTSRVYLPALGIAALAAVLVGLGWSGQWGDAGFAGSLTSLRVVLVGPLTLVIIGVIMVVERVWPAQHRSLFARGYRHDLLLTVMNVLLVAPLVTALTLSFVQVARDSLPWIVLPKIGMLPRWGVIAAIAVAMDFCNWSVHRANHRFRTLWRFHELHHSQEDMNVLTVFRTHPLIHVSYLVALIPGVVLLANGGLSITILALYGGIVAFAHSNTNLDFGPLRRIFVSPNFHRVHHQLDGPQDVNLGFALTIWDQMAHRAVFPTKEQAGMDTGLPGRPLAVEQAGEKPRHLSVLARQLVAPFRPMDARAQQSYLRSVSNPSDRAGHRPPCTVDGSEDLRARGEVA